MQVRNAFIHVNKDSERAWMAKDPLDKCVVVNAESEQKSENLNVSIIIVFGGQCTTCIGALGAPLVHATV